MKNGQIPPTPNTPESRPHRICCGPKARRQKNCLLTVILIAILIVVIGLLYLGFRVEIEVCTTPSCVRTATEILSRIDTKADPCEDFYRFSCGNFLQNTNLDNRGSRSVQDITEDEIRSEIRRMLEQPIHREDPRALNTAKKFYRACMNETAIEEEGLKKIKQIFEQMGGWPTLEGYNWKEDRFDWMEAVPKLRRMGVDFDVFFRVSVDRDKRDDSRYVLGFDFAGLESGQMKLVERSFGGISSLQARTDSILPRFAHNKSYKIINKNTEDTGVADAIHIYTDGSKTERGSGCGIYSRSLNLNIKKTLDKYASVAQIELIGITMAAKEITGKNLTGRTMYIFTYSLSKIRRASTGISETIHDTTYSPSELSSEVKSMYLNYMADVAVLFGANRETAKRDSNEVLKLFLELAKISKESSSTNTTSEERLSLSELQYKYPSIQWYQFISGIMDPAESIGYDDDVIVSESLYLKRVEILLSYMPKRSIANFIAWHTLQYLINFLPSEILSLAYDFLENINGRIMRPVTPRWETCLDSTETRMSSVISAAYIQNFFPEDVRTRIVGMIRNIKAQFQTNLLRLDWIDQKTKVLILEQLHASTEEIPSYGDLLEILEGNRIYDEAKVSETKYLQSALNLNLINLDKEFKKLRTKPDDRWFEDITFITGFMVQYSPKKNTLTFPIGIFRGIYYKDDRPEYMNYGSLGSIIAHEISHIFVKAKYGELPGELRSWWSPNSLLNYDEKLQCLSNQYGNFVVSELRGKHLNPTKTRDEDMADLAGMKISYDTYINWVQENGPEPLLPGLNYSPNQLFWIASAIRHCSKHSAEDLERYIDNYQWSPQQFRVNGPLQNLKEFVFDFGCRKGSKMNQGTKCDIW